MKRIALVFAILVLCAQSSAEPDLEIARIHIAPEPLTTEQEFEVHYDIRNSGDEDVVDMFVVAMDVGDESYDLYIEDPIPAGETVEFLDRGWSAFHTPGRYDVYVEVDAHGNITESDEEDNVYESTVDVIDRPADSAPGPKAVQGGDVLDLAFILMIASMVVAVAASLIISRQKKAHPSVEPELERLQHEKEKLEKIIKLAQVKYYKRKLDEESYKGIIKDNQERLLEVEERIGELEDRVGDIEGKLKSKGKKRK